ncbi:MAG: hypothetical protein N3A58_04255 [Spirochaetes bacterium]|nr:hypothetical protein [Spirochaetota bacterium]
MKNQELISQIVSEILHFLLSFDPKNIVISVHQEKDGVHICIIDDLKRSKEEIEKIKNSLYAEYRPEVAGYYGNLIGYDLLGKTNLSLLGWDVKYINFEDTKKDGIKIDIWIGSSEFDPKKFTIPI